MDSSLLYFIFSLVAVTIVAIGVIYRFRVRRARGELTQLALLTSHVNQGTYPIHIYTQRQGVGNNNNISSASDGRRKGCLTMQELDAMFPSTRFCDLSPIHRAAILRSSDPNSSSSADKHDTDSIKSSKLQLQQQQQEQANPSSSITTDAKNRSSSPPPPFSSTVSEVDSSTVFINESTTTDTEPPTKTTVITQKPITEDTRIDRDSIDLEAQKNCLTVKESEIAQPQIVLDRHEQEGNSLICVICQDDIITTDVEPIAISSTSKTEKGTTKSNTRDDTSSDSDSSSSSNSSSSSSETDSDEESEKENLNEKLMVRVLLCNHCFHSSCITRWLVNTKAVCPLCFRNVLLDVPEAAHIENTPIRYTGSTTSSFSTSSSGSSSR